MCGVSIMVDTWEMRRRLKKNKRGLYCSRACTNAGHSLTMARTNRSYASARMKKNNPMHRPEIRAAVSTKLRAMGHKPRVHGGNGRPVPVPQLLLACVLGWDTEVAVKTGEKRGSGYPSCYKVDIGNEDLMIALEIDGNSHCALKRKEQDKKKDAFLNGLGWTVLRFKNEQVMEDLEGCVRMVLSTI